jgi:PTS system cellobiose-specific IIB component
MEKAAKDKGKNYKIWAVPEAKATDEIPLADVVLIGPQMRFWKKEAEKIAKPRGIPVEVINPVDYGMVNGKAVLEFAEKLTSRE